MSGAVSNHCFHPSILREYDIRGTVGATLSEADAHAVGRSFATLLRRAGGSRVAVGRDARLSSPMLEAALVAGLRESGADVVRIGMGPTPMLYYAEASTEQVHGGIQVTGSHNPKHDNGFKMVLHGLPFHGEDIARLGRIAAAGDWLAGKGSLDSRDVLDAYVDRLLAAVAGIGDERLSALRIGWDAGNGAAGPALERLLARLPGEHHVLFAEPDGNFPNHHPDPTVEANLADLRHLVADRRLHFGIAFDGDADRIVAVDSLGRPIWGDQLLMIFAEDLLRRRPKSLIIGDVKASKALFDRIAELGGQPLMWKTGHSLIKSKMKETAAPLGGEMTGHVFFADEYYGFDDALYAGLRLIAAASRLGRSVTELRDAMPAMANTPELRFAVPAGRKAAAVAEVRARLEAAGRAFVAIDGVRVESPDGWWLLRASNTQDVLTARAESAEAAGLARLVAEIDAQLAASGLSRGGEG
ncbi:MAG: phosphomannomutase/phosphoglucomutase [Sphingomonadales bacterium]|nr:phosphomannomutase/phosphoglucomutase [Sphingomonadales bacterium]